MVALGKASNAFLAWSASQGIETTLNLAERADGRFVTCSQDINAGQDLLSCPLSACIVADSLEGERCQEMSHRLSILNNLLLFKLNHLGVVISLQRLQNI